MALDTIPRSTLIPTTLLLHERRQIRKTDFIEAIADLPQVENREEAQHIVTSLRKMEVITASENHFILSDSCINDYIALGNNLNK